MGSASLDPFLFGDERFHDLGRMDIVSTKDPAYVRRGKLFSGTGKLMSVGRNIIESSLVFYPVGFQILCFVFCACNTGPDLCAFFCL